MEYKCETNRHGRDTRDAYAIQFTDDAGYVDVRGDDFGGVAITMADQSGNTVGAAVVQVKDFVAIARLLQGA